MSAKAAARYDAGRPPVELLDDAAALLRRAPGGIVCLYYLGGVPFILGLLYYCSEMAQGSHAYQHLESGSWTMTGLYLWMKTWQAIFAAELMGTLEGRRQPWTARRLRRTVLLQAIFAGSWPIVYPAAFLMTVPFAWVNAFYHNVSVFGTAEDGTVQSTFLQAARQASLWPKQSWLMVVVLFLAGSLLFLNVAIFYFALPHILKTFFGVETILSENHAALWNSTSFMIVAGVSYLLLNPLSKAAFVLRCFYGQSLRTGADLRAGLRQLRATRAVVPAILLLCLIPLMGKAAQAERGEQAVRLDRAIDQTLQKDEYNWRTERIDKEENGESFLSRTMKHLFEFAKSSLKKMFEIARKIYRWLFPEKKSSTDRDNGAAPTSRWKIMLWGLFGLILAALTAALYRHRRLLSRLPRVSLAMTPRKSIDLTDERVQADELPEDSWLALAQELIDRGELRLALRAFYLATLSRLGRARLLRLMPAKSNRDYLGELSRRLRDQPQVVETFRNGVYLFEASWYGTHEVTPDVLKTAQAQHQTVRDYVAA